MNVAIYEHTADLPVLPESIYFHSRELMELCEQVPRHKPYMAVVTDDDGNVTAHLLAIVRFRRSWFPPYYLIYISTCASMATTTSKSCHLSRGFLKELRKQLQSTSTRGIEMHVRKASMYMGISVKFVEWILKRCMENWGEVLFIYIMLCQSRLSEKNICLTQ